MEQRGNDLIDQDIPERQIGPIYSLCNEKRELPSAREEQQRMGDDAPEIRKRIAANRRQLEPRLANSGYAGKRALSGAFGVRVEASRGDVSMTVVLDPRYAEFTTTARTSA